MWKSQPKGRAVLTLCCLFINARAVEAFAPCRTTISCHIKTTGLSSSSTYITAAKAGVDSCDVAVMGGGFGGLYTALAISRQAKQQRQNLDIVLVEPTENFVFLPLLYDLTVGTATEAEVCPAYRELLEGTGIRQVRASFESFRILTDNNNKNHKNNNNNNPQSAILQPATPQSPSKISFRACVVAVGASPESILASVPGALDYAQPFYTEADAKKTRRLLARLQERLDNGKEAPRIAIVGGGFGGVELAASMKRKIPRASVTLLSRGPPMAGTRAEPLIDKALEKLGVVVEQCSVQAIETAPSKESSTNNPLEQPIIIKRTKWGDETQKLLDLEPWDAVLWTAGSAPAHPVSDALCEFRKSESGRLGVDSSLRCFLCEEVEMSSSADDDGNDASSVRKVRTGKLNQPPIWALGDCAEIVSVTNQPVVPKTAQAAMQQAETVAFNLLAQLQVEGKQRAPLKKSFQYQDLGSMLTLGGPNAAMMAPKEGVFAPLFTPMLDTVGGALGFADKVLEATVGRSPVIKQLGLNPETLGLSLGSYGIGVESGAAPGTLAGTITGAARRAVYAARMPTNRQRAVAATSAAISTAVALAREAASSSTTKKK